MTDADYLAVFHQVLLPMASEVHFCWRVCICVFCFKVASEDTLQVEV
jgi:hypothetical protein